MCGRHVKTFVNAADAALEIASSDEQQDENDWQWQSEEQTKQRVLNFAQTQATNGFHGSIPRGVIKLRRD